MKTWIDELKQKIEAPIIIAIAGNKADLLEQEEVDLGTSQNYAESISALFKQTSAKENIGIDELFMLIARKMLGNENKDKLSIRLNPGKHLPDDKIIIKEDKKCCH